MVSKRYINNKARTYATVLVLTFASIFSTSLISQNYFSLLGMEGVELYGSINHGFIDEFTTLPPGLYHFNASDRYRPEISSPLISTNISGGCTYNNGKIYTNEFDDNGFVMMKKPKWTIYNADTFEKLSETELPDNCQCTTRSLAYDITSDKIYGLNYTYTETFLVEIDPETGNMKRIGEQLDPKVKFYSIACNHKGMLYGIYLKENSITGDQQHFLVKIQKTTGKIAMVGEIKATDLLPNDLLINMKYKQTIFFDNSRNRLYWMLGSSSLALNDSYTAILEINPMNAQAKLVAYINKLYHISGAFFKEPADNVPAIISDFSCVPEATGATDVRFKITLPLTTYNGSQLQDEQLTVIVEENGCELLRGYAAPGSEFTSNIISLSNELHNVKVRVENERGSGPAVPRSFYVGYDVPEACGNIQLKSDGLTTTLTWDAPTSGQNGAPINSDNLTYKIIRWPNKTTVAEGLKERIFTETHPSDMTCYTYAVVPVDGTREGTLAYSNNLVVGSPLNPPYGGIFKDYTDMYFYYTVLDTNQDRFTWNYDSNTASAYYYYNIYNNADDWLISPPINYQKDKEYLLKFKAYSSLNTYLESMEIRFGQDRTPEGQNRLLLDIPAVPSVDEDHPVTQYEVPFTVENDGVYYYSFHAYTERYHEYLFVFDIKVAEKENSSVSADISDELPVAVKAIDRTIYIANPANKTVCIYNTNGQLIAHTDSQDAHVSVQPGIYLVNAGQKVFKIAVY